MNNKYNLEERTFKFAKDVRKLVAPNIQNFEDGKQLVRSSGSIGANYIEANESFSKKDFNYRAKICRKESKETIYWLRLIDTGETSDIEELQEAMLREAGELMRIFGSIVRKTDL